MTNEGRDAKYEQLRRVIDASGGPDKYIDADEEKNIFREGGNLGLDSNTTEAMLNHFCRSNSWTRERDIVQDLYDQLEEATKDDGVIDQKEFDHCVNYAVAMNMPRKRAMQLSVKFVLDKGLDIKKKWLGDWFGDLRKQYGI